MNERVLAIDVGASTADILVFEGGQTPENAVRLVVPSRTQIVAAAIRAATRQAERVVFRGPLMGGGASTAAMKDHVAAGLDFLATEEAALTFADDLEQVRDRGVRLVSATEAEQAVRGGAHDVRGGDVDAASLTAALDRLGVATTFTSAAVAVQDHGFDPKGSNREARFELWRRALLARRRIDDLFYLAQEIPADLTRMRAAAAGLSTVAGRVMASDTGPAALYGALPEGTQDAVLINVGNCHVICAVALAGRLAGVFEHHTDSVDAVRLEEFLKRFLAGELTSDEVRADHGHGAVIAGPLPPDLPIFVTGPRRALLAESRLPLVFAAPHGDMMHTGCWGLVRAARERSAAAGAGPDSS